MTDEQLAREIAERNHECGHVQGDLICTRPRDHEGNHRGQPIRKAIPFK